MMIKKEKRIKDADAGINQLAIVATPAPLNQEVKVEEEAANLRSPLQRLDNEEGMKCC